MTSNPEHKGINPNHYRLTGTLPTTPWDALRDVSDLVDDEADRKIAHATFLTETAGGAKNLSLRKQREVSRAGVTASAMMRTARTLDTQAAVLERMWVGPGEPMEHPDHRVEITCTIEETLWLSCSCGIDLAEAQRISPLAAAKITFDHVREAIS